MNKKSMTIIIIIVLVIAGYFLLEKIKYQARHAQDDDLAEFRKTRMNNDGTPVFQGVVPSKEESKPNAYNGGWLRGKWVAKPMTGNGEILGEEIEFTDPSMDFKDGQKEFYVYRDGKIVDRSTWEYNGDPYITIIKGTTRQKFRIDFMINTGELEVNYANYPNPSVGEPAVGYYTKVK